MKSFSKKTCVHTSPSRWPCHLKGLWLIPPIFLFEEKETSEIEHGRMEEFKLVMWFEELQYKFGKICFQYISASKDVSNVKPMACFDKLIQYWISKVLSEEYFSVGFLYLISRTFDPRSHATTLIMKLTLASHIFPHWPRK